jgi:acyl-CoA synthetase (AMP-forming)/AMP-acid ligase II
MVPLQIVVRRADLPRNPNGKIDRKALVEEFRALFPEPMP